MTGAGEFILTSFATPTLPAGAYHLRAEQQMNQQGPAIPGFTIDPRDAFFEVTAPRFALPADQILSTYPPNRSAGLFSSRLPQIVLRRRTLPWERRAGAGQPPEVPWLALVLLADGEGEFKTNVPVAQCVTVGVGMAGRSDAVLGDCLTVSNRIRAGAFPHLDEVGLLAHVRQVDLTDTELALGDDDGFLGVVVANRLPVAGLSYTAYLISLENQIATLGPSSEHEDHDTAQHGAPFLPDQPFTTWPVLAHWSFTCVGEGDFQSLLQQIDVGMLGRIRVPGASVGGKPPPPARPDPPQVLPSGHLTVDHTSRDGEAGRVLYRGPLLPFPGTREGPGADGVLPLLHASDQARRVGPDGRENLALATAFEIGRLLALAEPSVVAALLLWRKQGLATARQAALLAAEPALAALGTADVGSGFAARAGLSLLAALGADDARRIGGRTGPVRSAGPLVEADGSRITEAPTLADVVLAGALVTSGPSARSDAGGATDLAGPTGPRLTGGDGGLTSPARASFLTGPLMLDATAEAAPRLAAQAAATTPGELLPPEVRTFLARGRLLEGVPFQHLVPDSELLPTESIRFFFLDREWTDALVQGVLSVGTVTTLDHHQLELLHAAIRAEVDGEERRVRMVGGEQVGFAPAGPVTGFLLRSRAVSGWPAVHVRGYSVDLKPDDAEIDFNDARRVRLLRLERLAPAVLLCLFDGVPTVVHVEEPRQGVQYGVDLDPGGAQLHLRNVIDGKYVDDPSHLNITPPFTVRVPFRNIFTGTEAKAGPPGVVAVRHLGERMRAISSTKIGIQSTLGITSAQVAMELVQFPFRQVFGPGGTALAAAEPRDAAFAPSVGPADGVTGTEPPPAGADEPTTGRSLS